MQEVKEEISQELYIRYQAMNRSEFLKAIDKQIPLEWRFGYGYYGARLEQMDDKYYVVYTVGDSCD
jgi:hypothetical protein